MSYETLSWFEGLSIDRPTLGSTAVGTCGEVWEPWNHPFALQCNYAYKLTFVPIPKFSPYHKVITIKYLRMPTVVIPFNVEKEAEKVKNLIANGYKEDHDTTTGW
jgi:hypothetical protein